MGELRGGEEHRAVLGLLTQSGVRGYGGQAGDAAQSAQPGRCGVQHLGFHLARGVGGRTGGGGDKGGVRHGEGRGIEQINNLLLGQLGNGSRAAVLHRRRPGGRFVLIAGAGQREFAIIRDKVDIRHILTCIAAENNSKRLFSGAQARLPDPVLGRLADYLAQLYRKRAVAETLEPDASILQQTVPMYAVGADIGAKLCIKTSVPVFDHFGTVVTVVTDRNGAAGRNMIEPYSGPRPKEVHPPQKAHR